MRRVAAAVMWVGMAVCAAGAQEVVPSPIVEGKRALATKQFARAKIIFTDFLRNHPTDVQAQLGVADAELGLHQCEAAELEYRRVVATQPLLWAAHRNLVIVEAALGRWEEFDRERALLRAARARAAAGISSRDSDVIDVLTLRSGSPSTETRWIVRDYFEPLGRSQALYNFERFSPDGRVLAYVSLEASRALREELKGGAVAVGVLPPKPADSTGLALNFYDGKSHGTIARYAVEPSYERVRSDFLRWARSRRSR